MTGKETTQMHRSFAQFALNELGGDASYDECQEFLKPLFAEGAFLDKRELNAVNRKLSGNQKSLPSKADRDASRLQRILKEEYGMDALRAVLTRLDRDELLKLLGLSQQR